MTMSQNVRDTAEEYAITVDYDRDLADMVDSTGPTNRTSPEQVEEIARKWPIDGSGKSDRTAVMVTFPRYSTTREAEAAIRRRGLRAARLEELLAFGERYPDVQDSISVVALGSSCVDHLGRRRVPMLATTQLMYGEELRHLMDVSGDADAQWVGAGFLAVRE